MRKYVPQQSRACRGFSPGVKQDRQASPSLDRRKEFCHFGLDFRNRTEVAEDKHPCFSHQVQGTQNVPCAKVLEAFAGMTECPLSGRIDKHDCRRGLPSPINDHSLSIDPVSGELRTEVLAETVISNPCDRTYSKPKLDQIYPAMTTSNGRRRLK